MTQSYFNEETKSLTIAGQGLPINVKFPFEAKIIDEKEETHTCHVLGYLEGNNTWVVSYRGAPYEHSSTFLKKEVFIDEIPYITPPDWFTIDRITLKPVFKVSTVNEKIYQVVYKISGRELSIQFLTGEMDLINHTDPKTEIYFKPEQVPLDFAGWVIGKDNMIHFIDRPNGILHAFDEFEMIRMPIPEKLKTQKKFNTLQIKPLEYDT